MKTTTKFSVLFIIAVFSLFISCDKINEPYKVASNIVIDTTDTNGIAFVKKVFIEDFTGHRCGNCPRAHEIIHTLESTYPGKIISAGIHVGWYAAPLGDYTADYRTSTGDELNTFFGAELAGLPTGCVNRIEDQGNKLINKDKWTSTASQLLSEEPNIGIDIENTYNQSTRIVDISVDVKILQNINNDLFLTLYIVEDSIVSRQLDYDATPNDIENYTHRHVLRDAINTTWGEKIFTGGAVIDDTSQNTFSYTLDASWNENHCSIIAFIYDELTMEIYQVEEEHIISN